jgi:hypothetical protein
MAKTMATTADGIIFYLLGTVLLGPHAWNTGNLLFSFSLSLITHIRFELLHQRFHSDWIRSLYHRPFCR